MQHTLQFKHQPEELPTTSTSGYLPIHEVPEWTGNSATDENIHPLEHVESEIIIADDEFNKNNFLTPEDFTEGAILARKKSSLQGRILTTGKLRESDFDLPQIKNDTETFPSLVDSEVISVDDEFSKRNRLTREDFTEAAIKERRSEIGNFFLEDTNSQISPAPSEFQYKEQSKPRLTRSDFSKESIEAERRKMGHISTNPNWKIETTEFAKLTPKSSTKQEKKKRGFFSSFFAKLLGKSRE